MALNYTDTFSNIGIFAGAWFNLQQADWYADTIAQRQSAASLMDDSLEELEAATAFNDYADRLLTQFNNNKSTLVSALTSSYIQKKLKSDMNYVGQNTPYAILSELKYQMEQDSEYLVKCTITNPSAPTLKTGATGNGTLAVNNFTQLNVSQQFKATCINAATAGSEVFRITNEVDISIPTQVTVGGGATSIVTNLGEEYFDVTITAGGVNFAVGDEFRWTMASDEAGVFQTFFVNAYKIALPASASYSTINDNLVI